MRASPSIISELEDSFIQKSSARQADILSRITDLFVVQADHFRDPMVELFDEVMSCLALRSDMDSRTLMAGRLAHVVNAPPRMIRQLAEDEISVAALVLARSVRLSEVELAEIAGKHSNQHLLAIASRVFLSSPVTDVLVERGDEKVVHRVAGNAGAQFSEYGFETLADKASRDETLRAMLGRRTDVPGQYLEALVKAAQNAARLDIKSSARGSGSGALVHPMPPHVGRDAVRRPKLLHDYSKALVTLKMRLESQSLTEADLVNYARKEQFEEVVCTLSWLGKVPLAMAERLFSAPDTDPLLIFSRSINLAWPTVRCLLAFRGSRPSATALADLLDNYQKLSPQTAQRVLRFLHVRQPGPVAAHI